MSSFWTTAGNCGYAAMPTGEAYELFFTTPDENGISDSRIEKYSEDEGPDVYAVAPVMLALGIEADEAGSDPPTLAVFGTKEALIDFLQRVLADVQRLPDDLGPPPYMEGLAPIEDEEVEGGRFTVRMQHPSLS